MMSPVLFRNIFVLFFIIYSANLIAQNGWSEPINLSITDHGTIGKSFTIDRDRVIYLVWGDQDPQLRRTSILMRNSSNNGITWSEPQVITDNQGDYWFPEIAVDSKGILHVLYWSANDYRLFYINSENNWAEPYALSDPPIQNGRIIVDKEDVVHCFWTLNNSFERLVKYRYRKEGIWSEPEVISDVSTKSFDTQVAVDDENFLHIVFSGINSRNGFNGIFFRKIRGDIWGEIETVAEDSLDLREFQITLIQNEPIIVWSQAIQYEPELVQKIFWSRKNVIWSLPQSVNSIANSYQPDICTDTKNIVHLVWTKRILHFSEYDSLYYSSFINSNWSEPHVLNLNLSSPLNESILGINQDRLLMFLELSHQKLFFTSRSIITSLSDSIVSPNDRFSLAIYPNPFNSETIIKYILSIPARTEIKLYDILGREIQTLVSEEKKTGSYEFHFYADDLPSGIYFLRLVADNKIIFKKLLLTK